MYYDGIFDGLSYDEQYKLMNQKFTELFSDNSLSDDDKYIRWKELKKQQARITSHDAQLLPADFPLWDVYASIRDICNIGKKGKESFPEFANLYFMPPDLEREHADAPCIYGHGNILFRKSFYEERGAYDDDVIDGMFHEMIHYYCKDKVPNARIKDTDNGFHNESFKEVCEHFGGVCRYVNAEVGYNDARLPEGLKRRVRDEIKRLQKKNDNG